MKQQKQSRIKRSKMRQDIDYGRFAMNLMDSILQKRQSLINLSQQAESTQQFLKMIIDDKEYEEEFINFVKHNKSLEDMLSRMKRKVNKNISQQKYKETIEYTKNQIQSQLEQFQYFYQQHFIDNQDELNVSIIPKKVVQSKLKEQQDLQKEQQGKCKKQSDQFNYQQGESSKQPYHKYKLPQSKLQFKPNTMEKSSLMPKHLEATSNHLLQHIPHQLNIDQLQVQIRYLQTSVEYENYQYNNHSLQLCLQKLIHKYLTENQIFVRNKVPQIKIMQKIQFLKSRDAGNYRFNPFCDVLEIYITKINNTAFDSDFTVTGNIQELKIVSKPIPLKQWNTKLSNLTPQSSIEELVKYVCQKRQANSSLSKALSQGLKNLGGANIAQDLFGWQRSDYANMKVKPTYIFEIQEVIEQIKDSSSVASEKSVDEQRMQCLKIANSHKILRYVVYKLYGQNQVKKIAWLNMKNLRKAIQIVRKQIHNKELLDQLEDFFNQYALDPEGKPLSFERGMILYGPPGTGKTVLTEALPNIMGFHLIEKGLSAADFMKSLVGQSSRMIKDLVNRAAISPHLLCSVGIDEVDGLVPDRKDKDQKNKGEGISIMLSVIGGNKDVPNLIYMTSTNYIKKIDEAIGRRLSGKFQVGRPNPTERQKIVQERIQYFKNNRQNMDHLIRITTNFTGAALGGLANTLLKSLKVKKMEGESQELKKGEITQAAIKIAKQFNINLGAYTLPQIYRSQQNKNYIFTQNFLKRISNRFLLVQHKNLGQIKFLYANQIHKFLEGQPQPIYEIEEERIMIKVQKQDKFDAFTNYFKRKIIDKKYNVQPFKAQQSYERYVKKIKLFLSNYRDTKKTILIIQHYKNYPSEICFLKVNELKNPNLYLFYYIPPEQELKKVGQTFFSSDQQNSNINFENQVNYSGRIMVELNEETRMAFELKNCLETQSRVAFKNFLKIEDFPTSKTVIPQLVDFFTKKQLSYILLIDYELICQNNAFQQSKILQVLQEKMFEAKSYKKSAVIIDVDSLIMLNQSISDSSFGRNASYSIQNFNVYQILTNYMRQFTSASEDNSRWITIVVKHKQLIMILKKQLSWPKYPAEIKKEMEQEALNQERFCYRCSMFYTERQNKKERKCMQHPGPIIDTVTEIQITSSLQEIKAKSFIQRKKDKAKEQNKYIFICCFKGINEQGQRAYYHITKQQFQTSADELWMQKISNPDKWKQKLDYFKSELY